MTVADIRAREAHTEEGTQGSHQAVEAGSARLARPLRAAGEVQEISGAEREAEIGGIVDLYMRKMGNRAVLFDDIPGYPRGHRILANILTSVRRINLTLGMPIDGSAIELVSYWRKYMKEARSIAPVTVKIRAAHGERQLGQGHRYPEDPDAALARARRRLLHRHRLHGDHEGSRHRLDQLRRLPRAIARARRSRRSCARRASTAT